MDDNDHLIELWTDGIEWYYGSLTAKQYTIAKGSSLATIWQRYDGCNDCYGTPIFIIYQDNGNFLQFGNLSAGGFNWLQLEANPMAGTGIAINLLPREDGSAAFRIYYQIASGDLVSLDYETRGGEQDTSKPPRLEYIERSRLITDIQTTPKVGISTKTLLSALRQIKHRSPVSFPVRTPKTHPNL